MLTTDDLKFAAACLLLTFGRKYDVGFSGNHMIPYHLHEAVDAVDRIAQHYRSVGQEDE